MALAHADDIRQRITIHQRRLQILEEQRARYGLDVPPHIVLEIQDIQKQIGDLEKELAELNQSEFYSLSPERPDTVIADGAALPDLVVRPGLNIDLTEAEQALIQHLFPDRHALVIEQEFGDGYSGCRVFLVSSWGKLRRAPLVVKIGPIELIQDEEQRYQKYVANTLSLLAAAIDRVIKHAQMGAIGYPYLGGAMLGDETCSLGEYYRSHSAAKTLKVLEYLLVEALGTSWYLQRQALLQPLYFEKYYGAHFPADITLSLDQISLSPIAPDPAYQHFADMTLRSDDQAIKIGMAVQIDGLFVRRHNDRRIDLSPARGLPRLRVNVGANAGSLPALKRSRPVWVRGTVTSRRTEDLAMIMQTIFAGFPDAVIDPYAPKITLAGVSYTNPLAVYQTYLNQALPQNVAPIHGDLHLSNILVDRFGKAWVIDPGRADEGHVLFDFIELETHLRHAILGDMAFTLADLADFEQRLIHSTTTRRGSSPPAHPELAKAFNVIRGIRKFAKLYSAPENPAAKRSFAEEYFPALLLYTLATLKHYKDNGASSARHAFLTAALLATWLEGKFDRPAASISTPTVIDAVTQYQARDLVGTIANNAMQQPAEQPDVVAEPHQASNANQPVDLAVTDPVLEYQAYYLAKVAGDTEPQIAARRQVFVAELQHMADRLRGKLDLPPVPIVWEQEASTHPSMMLRRYFSGQWQNAADTIHAWLVAYQMHDTYLLRCAVEQPGQGYAPDAFTRLRDWLPWQPDIELPEWLGQHLLYYTSRYNGPVAELTRIVFHDSALWHTSLMCGELYCLPKLETPYLLVGATPQQEGVADQFFDSLAPQLGWYIHKIIGQKKQYDTHLSPILNDFDKLASIYLAEARRLDSSARQSHQHAETRQALQEQVESLVGLALDYRAFLTTAEHILHAIDINIANYQRATDLDEYLAEPLRNQIFIKQRRSLDRVSEQIKADITRWRITLDAAEKSLMLLRP